MTMERSWNRSKYETPEPPKSKSTVKFYSEVGKKRLQNIWTDQDLDQENFFSSWIEYGPSTALTNEKVSDFIHNYLQVKNKTIVAMNHLFNARYRAVDSSEEFFEKFGSSHKIKEKPPYYFQVVAGASQAVYDSVMDDRMDSRRKMEILRIKKLIINRITQPPPNFKHPILNLNILNGKLAKLQELEKLNKKRLMFGELPRIRHFDGSKLFRKKRKNDKKGLTSIQHGQDQENRIMTLDESRKQVEQVATKLDDDDDQYQEELVQLAGDDDRETTELSVDFSVQSEPPLASSSPTIRIQIVIDHHRPSAEEEERLLENSEFEELSNIWEREREENYSRSYSSDIDDIEIFTEAEQFYFYGVSGDVEYTKEFPFVPSLVEDAVNAKTVSEMFEESNQTVLAFRRQFFTATDSVIKLNRLFLEMRTRTK